MFPNIRVMTVAMFASVFALSFGFGLFAEFRVSHEPLARPPVISEPAQPDGQRLHATRLIVADSPFAMRFQTPEPQREEISATSPSAASLAAASLSPASPEPDIAEQSEPPHDETPPASPGLDLDGHDAPQLTAAATGAPEPESEPAPAVVGTLTAESPLQYAGLPNVAQCVDLPIARPAAVETFDATQATASDGDTSRERSAAGPAETPPPEPAGEQDRTEQPQPDLAPAGRTPGEENSAVAAVEPLIPAPAISQTATMPEIKIGARQKPAAKPRRAVIARQRLAARTHNRFRPRRHLVVRNVEQPQFNFGYAPLFQIEDQPLLNVQTAPQSPQRRMVLRRHRPATQPQPQKARTQQSAVGGPFVDPQAQNRQSPDSEIRKN